VCVGVFEVPRRVQVLLVMSTASVGLTSTTNARREQKSVSHFL